MRVRLSSRWGARLPGSIVSVSTERAIYLRDVLRIGKIIDPVPKAAERAAAKKNIINNAPEKESKSE